MKNELSGLAWENVFENYNCDVAIAPIIHVAWNFADVWGVVGGMGPDPEWIVDGF